jgi:hypothetical protein
LQDEYLTYNTFPETTAYGVGGALLRFLQDMPEPAIPFADFKSFIVCASIPNTDASGAAAVTTDSMECSSQRCQKFRDLFDALPMCHRCDFHHLQPLLSCAVCVLAHDGSTCSGR